MKHSMISLTITIAALEFDCAHNLPPDFPQPPVVNLCVPVLSAAKGEAPRQVSYWRCRRTDSQEIRSEPATYVHVGVPVEDWNQGQKYRSEVEAYFKSHRCSPR